MFRLAPIFVWFEGVWSPMCIEKTPTTQRRPRFQAISRTILLSCTFPLLPSHHGDGFPHTQQKSLFCCSNLPQLWINTCRNKRPGTSSFMLPVVRDSVTVELITFLVTFGNVNNGHEPDARRAWLRAGLETRRVLPQFTVHHVGRG